MHILSQHMNEMQHIWSHLVSLWWKHQNMAQGVSYDWWKRTIRSLNHCSALQPPSPHVPGLPVTASVQTRLSPSLQRPAQQRGRRGEGSGGRVPPWEWGGPSSLPSSSCLPFAWLHWPGRMVARRGSFAWRWLWKNKSTQWSTSRQDTRKRTFLVVIKPSFS